MPVFALRLNSPRASFPADMTAEEAALMGRHVAYWQGLVERGVAAVFGPVLDPARVWGLAVIEVDDAAAAQAIADADPVITARAGFSFDVLPMMNAVVRPASASAR